jgi:hypothetical protein
MPIARTIQLVDKPKRATDPKYNAQGIRLRRTKATASAWFTKDWVLLDAELRYPNGHTRQVVPYGPIWSDIEALTPFFRKQVASPTGGGPRQY